MVPKTQIWSGKGFNTVAKHKLSELIGSDSSCLDLSYNKTVEKSR